MKIIYSFSCYHICLTFTPTHSHTHIRIHLHILIKQKNIATSSTTWFPEINNLFFALFFFYIFPRNSYKQQENSPVLFYFLNQFLFFIIVYVTLSHVFFCFTPPKAIEHVFLYLTSIKFFLLDDEYHREATLPRKPVTLSTSCVFVLRPNEATTKIPKTNEFLTFNPSIWENCKNCN